MRLRVAMWIGSALTVLIGAGCGNDNGNTKDAGAGHDLAQPGGADLARTGGTDMADLAMPAAPDMTTPPDLGEPPGQTFTLTTANDSFTGTPRADTFVGNGAGVFATGDVLDGNGGTDTLTVTTSGNLSPGVVQVSNIEVASLTSGGDLVLDSSGWGGLVTLTTQSAGASTVKAGANTDVTANVPTLGAKSVLLDGGKGVTVVASAATTGTITVGGTTPPVGPISVQTSATTAGSLGSVTITGGTTVSVAQALATPVSTTSTLGSVTVNGSAATTGVTITNAAPAAADGSTAGVSENAVFVNDVHAGSTSAVGTIKSIAVSGYTFFSLADSGLTTLALTNGSGNMILDNSGLDTPSVTTLALTLDGTTGGTLDDADIYTALNITTANHPARLANITFGGMTALTLAGTQPLTLTSTAGSFALKTVAITGSAGLTADLSTGGGVTAVDASGTSGTNTITLNATQASYAGGSGVDKLTLISGSSSKTIDLGGGDDSLTMSFTPGAAVAAGAGSDTLIMDSTSAQVASSSTTFAAKVTGFEILQLNGATNQTIDVARLGGFGAVITRGGNGLTFANLPSGGTLTLTGAGTAYTVSNPAFAGVGVDVLNVVLSDNSTSAVYFDSTGLTAQNVETINLQVKDGQVSPSGTFSDGFTLLGNSAKTINVSGNAGLSLTATSTSLTSLDASGLTLGGLTWSSGALSGTATVKGSASGTNVVDLSAASQGVSYSGGAGPDNLTIMNSHANVINLGGGDNSLVFGAGSNGVTAGAGNDTIVGSTGNNTISIGDGNNSVTLTSGANHVTTGAGNDSITVGGGANVIDVGAGTDAVTLTGAPASVASCPQVTGLGSGDSLGLAATSGGATPGTTLSKAPSSADLNAYLDACAAGDGSATTRFCWFQVGGNTYVVNDISAASSFQVGIDTLVELIGTIDLGSATVASGRITF